VIYLSVFVGHSRFVSNNLTVLYRSSGPTLPNVSDEVEVLPDLLVKARRRWFDLKGFGHVELEHFVIDPDESEQHYLLRHDGRLWESRDGDLEERLQEHGWTHAHS
jgi:hypothetical protein